ncbi:hypothetical protein BGZ79_010520 [Entomortierella chlamydospora]|nr:hypothetical protein BGZ79_010520 [Entomortierella chlamydospora]
MDPQHIIVYTKRPLDKSLMGKAFEHFNPENIHYVLEDATLGEYWRCVRNFAADHPVANFFVVWDGLFYRDLPCFCVVFREYATLAESITLMADVSGLWRIALAAHANDRLPEDFDKEVQGRQDGILSFEQYFN